MIFYRVVNLVTGRGAYSHTDYCDQNNIDCKWRYDLVNMSLRHGSAVNSRRTPCLYEDELLYSGWSHTIKESTEGNYQIFCFESINHFKSWFSHEERELLNDAGFKLMSFECEVYNLYRKQATVPLNVFKHCKVLDVTSLLGH